MFLRNFDNYMLALMGVANNGAPASSVSTAWNNNFYVHGCFPLNNKNGRNDNIFGDGYLCFKAATGSIAAITPTYFASSTSSGGHTCVIISPLVMAKGNLCIGTGDTAVTYEDHKLSGEVVDNSKLVYVSHSIDFDADTKKYKKTITYTWTNATESDITIKEWGLYVINGYDENVISSPFNHSYNSHVLMFREVLRTPITIAAGTTGTLTFSIDLPMPNHP